MRRTGAARLKLTPEEARALDHIEISEVFGGASIKKYKK